MGYLPTLTDLIQLSLLIALAFGAMCSAAHLIFDTPASLESAGLVFCEAFAAAALASLLLSTLLWTFA